ncbi:putative predicted lipoprotein [Serratia symbiotica str. Tucson]|uniref:Lipoprotein n=3 Tax=Serratia symbiotica TaxID=138074 RepID=A0A455VFU1_9GAMM|nr:putative predicted lipoprotein [Serratia symbiotica str. Tucson]BBI91872.1 lipoprotein [Serratia symbiotica]
MSSLLYMEKFGNTVSLRYPFKVKVGDVDMRLILILSMLLLTQLFFNLAHAVPQARTTTEQRKSHAANEAQPDDHQKRKAVKARKKVKVSARLPLKAKTQKIAKTVKVVPPRKGDKKRYDHQRQPGISKTIHPHDVRPLKLSLAHKKRYQHAKQTAMAKLMGQMGKPYHWGGSSPHTGFDCSGLIYYAYKDVVKIKMPRTTKEMYQLPHAAPIKKSELESGDLVFFRIHNHNVADHVGVYLGNGKFIQSPRSGEEIRISQLDNDYWQNHYIGARRVVTPQTIR